MKSMLILGALLLSNIWVNAQEEDAKKEIAFYSDLLHLTNIQQHRLAFIMDRKYNNLESISRFKSINHSYYRAKRRSIFISSQNSIELMLNENQWSKWKTYLQDQRKQNAVNMHKTLKSSKDKQDILDAQFGVKN